jgi:hypothetical protein
MHPRCKFLAAAGMTLSAAIPSACFGAMTLWQLEDTGRIGTLTTTILGAPAVTAGPQGRAIAFDGMDDAIFVPENPLAGWPEFTVEILFKPVSGGGFEQRFLHLGTPDGDRALIELRSTPDGNWYLDTFLQSGAAKLALIDPAKAHAGDAWYWVALRYDGEHMSHFVNGAFEMEKDLTIAPLPAGQASLGVRQTRVSWFKGEIREVRFHDSALAPDALQRRSE